MTGSEWAAIIASVCALLAAPFGLKLLSGVFGIVNRVLGWLLKRPAAAVAAEKRPTVHKGNGLLLLLAFLAVSLLGTSFAWGTAVLAEGKADDVSTHSVPLMVVFGGISAAVVFTWALARWVNGVERWKEATERRVSELERRKGHG